MNTHQLLEAIEGTRFLTMLANTCENIPEPERAPLDSDGEAALEVSVVRSRDKTDNDGVDYVMKICRERTRCISNICCNHDMHTRILDDEGHLALIRAMNFHDLPCKRYGAIGMVNLTSKNHRENIAKILRDSTQKPDPLEDVDGLLENGEESGYGHEDESKKDTLAEGCIGALVDLIKLKTDILGRKDKLRDDIECRRYATLALGNIAGCGRAVHQELQDGG
jgi:hypothetical protein